MHTHKSHMHVLDNSVCIHTSHTYMFWTAKYAYTQVTHIRPGRLSMHTYKLHMHVLDRIPLAISCDHLPYIYQIYIYKSSVHAAVFDDSITLCPCFFHHLLTSPYSLCHSIPLLPSFTLLLPYISPSTPGTLLNFFSDPRPDPRKL